jgi:GR25 family glycosyltransferase involved in LPS biosynthesis
MESVEYIELGVTIIVLLILIFIFAILKMKNTENEASSNKTHSNTIEKVVDWQYLHPITNEEIKTKLCHKYTSSCSPISFFSPCCVSNGIQLLKDVFETFKKHNIRIWITYGTLLGHIRHEGFIPWDDDIDTLALIEDRNIIETKICNDLKDKKYEIFFQKGDSENLDYPSYDYITVFFSETNKLHLDIGLCTRMKLERKEYLVDAPIEEHIKISKDINKYKSWISSCDDVFPLKRELLYNIEVFIPNKSEYILKNTYDEDCLVKSKVKIDSLPGTNDNLKEINIKKFSPALPLKLYSNNQNINETYGISSCYIVNLKERKDRLANTIKECDKYNLKVVPIEAVEGKKLNIDNLKINNIYKGNDMKINEIACSLSHIKILKEIADSNEKYPSIIFEDDIKILPEFDKIMKRLKHDRNHIDWDIIILGCRLANNKYQISDTNIPYLKKSGLSLGLWAYMVNPISARKILDNIYPITHPIDITITVQDPTYQSKYKHDTRFLNKIKKYVINTGNYFDNDRFGIVNELSTFVWTESTSQK